MKIDLRMEGEWKWLRNVSFLDEFISSEVKILSRNRPLA